MYIHLIVICLKIKMDQEKYSLTWKTYSEHLRKMIRGMLHLDEFSDVTLVCEDMKQFRAHKNILAACSPLFHSCYNQIKVDQLQFTSKVCYIQKWRHF